MDIREKLDEWVKSKKAQAKSKMEADKETAKTKGVFYAQFHDIELAVLDVLGPAHYETCESKAAMEAHVSKATAKRKSDALLPKEYDKRFHDAITFLLKELEKIS